MKEYNTVLVVFLFTVVTGRVTTSVSIPPTSTGEGCRHHNDQQHSPTSSTPWTDFFCSSILHFSNVSSLDRLACLKYPNRGEGEGDRHLLIVRSNDTTRLYDDLHHPGNYLVVNLDGILKIRPMFWLELSTIRRYNPDKVDSLVEEQQTKYNYTFREIRALQVIHNDSTVAEDRLYRHQRYRLPVFLLLRNVQWVDGKYLHSSYLPSLVVEVKFSNRSESDSFMIHFPGYYEVAVVESPSSSPPVIRTWTKEIFEEQRRKTGDEVEFDLMVGWLRDKGIPPPSIG